MEMLDVLEADYLPLSDLGRVPWAELHHAYGSAADVPALLRGLVGGPGQQQAAKSALWGNVYHQGTRWESSQYLIPFLVGLLVAPATPDRPWIAGYLTGIAMGGDAGDVQLRPYSAEELRQAAQPAESMSFAERAQTTAALYDDSQTWTMMLMPFTRGTSIGATQRLRVEERYFPGVLSLRHPTASASSLQQCSRGSRPASTVGTTMSRQV